MEKSATVSHSNCRSETPSNNPCNVDENFMLGREQPRHDLIDPIHTMKTAQISMPEANSPIFHTILSSGRPELHLIGSNNSQHSKQAARKIALPPPRKLSFPPAEGYNVTSRVMYTPYKLHCQLDQQPSTSSANDFIPFRNQAEHLARAAKQKITSASDKSDLQSQNKLNDDQNMDLSSLFGGINALSCLPRYIQLSCEAIQCMASPMKDIYACSLVHDVL